MSNVTIPHFPFKVIDLTHPIAPDSPSWDASCAEPIPEALWSMALSLYPEHKRSRICDCLRLSGTQFKQRLEGGGHTRANSGFVVASRDELKAMSASGTNVQLTLQGQVRSITLCFDIH